MSFRKSYHILSCPGLSNLNKCLTPLMVLLMLGGFSGCVSSLPQNTQIPDLPVAKERESTTGSHYKVITPTRSGNPHIFRGSIPEDKGITIQEVLEKSGTTQKYRAMMVDIARRIPETGEVLKLPVKYDPNEGTVSPEQNYAILPGDEILIRPDSFNLIDAALKMIVGDDPMSRR